jgi:hypothetical protein
MIKAKPLSELTDADFWAYEDVRRIGRFNMITEADSAARAAGLDIKTYYGVIMNYSKLQEQTDEGCRT